MPEFGQILDSALQAVAESTDRQELRRLEKHVDAVTRLAGEEPGTDELLQLARDGYLPHYDHAARATVTAQLAMSTHQERQAAGGGAVKVGPIELRGEFSNVFGQDTATNVSVVIEMERRLLSALWGDMRNALKSG